MTPTTASSLISATAQHEAKRAGRVQPPEPGRNAHCIEWVGARIDFCPSILNDLQIASGLLNDLQSAACCSSLRCRDWGSGSGEITSLRRLLSSAPAPSCRLGSLPRKLGHNILHLSNFDQLQCQADWSSSGSPVASPGLWGLAAGQTCHYPSSLIRLSLH